MSKKKHKKGTTIPITVTDSIPYEYVYENGIIEIAPGKFSKSYHIPEANFKTSSHQEQWLLAQRYSEFLGEIDPNILIQITLYNKTMDIAKFQEEVLFDMCADKLNHLREEYNQMLVEKMTNAKNNLQTIKILTLTLEENGIDNATEKFMQLDSIISDSLATMTKHDAMPLSIMERMEILNTIYNQDSTVPLYRKEIIEGHEAESFSLENCAKQGITTKDVIAPSCLSFDREKITIGNNIAKSFYISNYPSWIKGTMMTDFANLPINMLVTAYINGIPQEDAIKLVRRKRTDIGAKIVDTQKKSARSGIDASLISPDLAEAHEAAQELISDITRDNGHLFTTTFIITLFAPDEETMKNYELQMKAIASRNLVTVKSLGLLMEAGFNSSLPLGNYSMKIERLMNSDSIAGFNPFNVKEIRQKGGIYYGLNASSRNMIIYDRTTDLNPNGCILGMPGAGKSFTAKKEMISVLLNPATANDEIYVLDPENEYWKLTEAFGGSEVKVANGSEIHINPFDLNIDNSEDSGDPVKIKTDFIETVCEIAIGGRYGLSPIQISIIDRCVLKIYEPYIEYLRKTGKTIDIEKSPTMEDFYEELLVQPQPEAQELALSLERYVKGAQDIFSHMTNVEIDNRFTVFNIKNIGSGLKELGLHICLDHIWNKMIMNKAKGKRTWIFIDEFHMLMQKPSAAAYIAQIWKRARKWNGVCTAITQNIEDMLKSEDSRTIINNSSFIILLGQSPINKEHLSNLLNISKEEQKYISSAKPGTGLLRIKDDIIPMTDSFPKNTELYKIMTTKPNES